MNKKCYATLIYGNDYALGAICLNHCLKKVKSKYPLIVMICENTVDKEYLNLYDYYNIEYIIIPNNIFNNKDKRFYATINKFYIYELIEYNQVCFLDSDLIIFKNIDDIFNEQIPFGMIRWENEISGLTFYGGLFIINTKKDFFINTILKNDNYLNCKNDEEILILLSNIENFTLKMSGQINEKTFHWSGPNKYWQQESNIENILKLLEITIEKMSELKDISFLRKW